MKTTKRKSELTLSKVTDKILDCSKKTNNEWRVRLSGFNPGLVFAQRIEKVILTDFKKLAKDPSGPVFRPNSTLYYLGVLKHGFEFLIINVLL